MLIDRIIPYGKTRHKIIMDDGQAILLYNGEIIKLNIEEGRELDEETYIKTILPLLTKRALERVVHILETSDKTEAELRRKLKESFYPPEAIDYAIDYCKKHHYVDDRRYAENYVKYRSSGKSRRIIKQELLAKGIDKETVEALLDTAEIDESEHIAAELKKRHYSIDMEDKDKQRIYAALARKGYTWSQIQSVTYENFEM